MKPRGVARESKCTIAEVSAPDLVHSLPPNKPNRPVGEKLDGDKSWPKSWPESVENEILSLLFFGDVPRKAIMANMTVGGDESEVISKTVVRRK